MIKMAETEYQFKGNPIIQGVPVIGNLVYDERGKEVLAIHNKRFKEIPGIEDTTNYKPITFSNVPRILSYAQILRERFPDMHVLTPEEVVMNWDKIPERDGTYADTNSITIYPNPSRNEDLKKRVLELTGKKLGKTPLVVSGLGVEKADNDYRFTFTETDHTNAKLAPWLGKDGWVKYDQEKGEIVSCAQDEKGAVKVVVPDDQSGLRWLYRGGSGGLCAGGGGLLGSDVSGRVQVLYNPQGRTENLEGRIKELHEERERLRQEIDSRFSDALNYLRTGKLQ